MTLQFEQTTKQYASGQLKVLLSRSYLSAGTLLLLVWSFLYFYGPRATMVFFFAIFIVGSLSMWAGAIAAARVLRDAKGKIPWRVEVTEESINMTLGNKQSRTLVRRTLERNKVSKVWVTRKCVFINYRLQTIFIPVPEEKYELLVDALTGHGWFRKQPGGLKRWAALLAVGMVAGAVGTLSMYLLPPGHHRQTSYSNIPVPAELKESDILAAVNAVRKGHDLGTLTLDWNLVTTALQSCNEMEVYGYYGSKNPKTGHSGHEYISEIYPDSYVGEVMLAVTNDTATDVATRWVKDSESKEWVLGSNYTKAGVVTCNYTADDKYRALVVLHLAS